MIPSIDGIIILNLEDADAIVRAITDMFDWDKKNIRHLREIGSLQAISDLKSAVRAFEREEDC